MNTELIAMNPAEMVTAQNNLVAWCNNKLADVSNELVSAKEVLNALVAANMNSAKAQHVVKATERRIAFYGKIKAALEAGYYIIPPFPTQAFAVKSNRKKPQSDYGARHWVNEIPAQNLQIGEGEYHHPEPIRALASAVTVDDGKGDRKVERNYQNTEWKDVEFPFEVTRPELITAVGAALKKKIFDSFGVLPTYRTADPLIVGHIKHWKSGKSPITFFVTWWLDTNDL